MYIMYTDIPIPKQEKEDDGKNKNTLYIVFIPRPILYIYYLNGLTPTTTLLLTH